MENLETAAKKILELMGFSDFGVNVDEDSKKISIIVGDERLERWLPSLISSLDLLLRLVAKKNGQPALFVDVNYYRRERERLIAELARAAARKVLMTKSEVSLPPMNAYERRLVHLELSVRPDVRTDSVGEGRGRYVVVKPI